MTASIVFDPLVPWAMVIVGTALALWALAGLIWERHRPNLKTILAQA